MSTGRLMLFVTGDAPRSQRARGNLHRALEGVAAVEVEEIDLIEEPTRCVAFGIFATPALALVGEAGMSVLYGDLSDPDALNRFLAPLTIAASS